MMKNKYQYGDYLLCNPKCTSVTAWQTLTLSLLIMLMPVFTSFGQTASNGKRSVTGTVTSAVDNQGLPGVSILVKGTNNGIASDVNGKFTIQAADNDVLVVSYIGFTSQEIAVGNKTTINVILREDQKVLNEVVVTGYGELRKADVPGAQTTISSKAIEKTVNTTIEQAIQGRAPGVYVTQNTGAPGGGISVNIRGINSINGTNEPLYVIDGVQIQGSTSTSGSNPLSSLNPADIETMDILQGPSATAIYGSRATNGVVLITTKRGKSGDVKINYSYLYSLQTPPKELSIMNLREYARMDNEYKALNGGSVREDFLDPTILGAGTNWQKELFNNAPMNKHQLSLSGGGEKTTYYLSGEYLDQEGVAMGSGFDRGSFRLNLDNKARKWLNLGANLSFAQTNEQISTTQSDIINNAIQLSPAVPVRNINGTFGGGQTRPNPDGSANNAEQFSPPNPIGLANLVTNDIRRRRILGGLNATVNITEGLEFRTSFNGDFGFSNGNNFVPTYEFGFQRNGVSTLTVRDEFSSYWNWNQLLQYTRTIGKHRFTVMGSHEAQESTYRATVAGRRNFPTNEIIDLNAGGDANQTNGGGQNSWGMESYLGRINYNFGDRYILQANFRADGSGNFGAGNKWGYFPSVSAAWRVSEESFFNIPAISDVRLRVETGLTGSQGNSGPIYARLNLYPTEWGNGFLPANYPNENFQWEETKTNNIGINLGFLENRFQIEADYYVKNTDNLIILSSLPWYMGTTGAGSILAPTVNVGALQNKGWSFTFNSTNINKGDFRWETNLNISHFKPKITKLYTESSSIARNAPSWYISPQWSQRSEVGTTPWYFFGYVEDGIFQTVEEVTNSPRPADNNGKPLPVAANQVWVGDVKYRDLNGDGVITAADQTNIGSPWPTYFGGLTNTFSYKGIDLSILLTGTFGNDVYNYVRMRNSNPNNINLGQNMFLETLDYARVTADGTLENPGTNIPRMTGSVNNNYGRHTTKYVEDGSFVRVKNISVNYNLPTSLIARQKFVKGARFGISAQNLYTFTKYTGYDPEVGTYVGPNIGNDTAPIGVDTGRYPLTPIYSFNFGIDF
ncbi:TonB-dependent receptor [Adhaeribacter arboris]|uniref:TonB-dependent receptor n=1 Tax=Adhaeribacter arboris TaxID=2072846 RepID=A0A2T2YGW0_9BACT|nr:TonB-dependent receptor [Adhaeribacter arboris]PSR54722.1 TonB-dependent receptor [Adhaeribacter arboris]